MHRANRAAAPNVHTSMTRILALVAILVVLSPRLHASDRNDGPGHVQTDGLTPSRRAFALTQLNGPLEELLGRPEIDGVALQVSWSALEPSNDLYSWTELDAALAQAKSHGKEVTLHVLGTVSPWLKAAGVQTYSFVDFQQKSHEEAVPWDAIYLSEFTKFLGAFRDHLTGAGYVQTIARISVGVPVAEMDLIACSNGMLAPQVRYDRAIYLAAWKRMIDAYHAAFPDTKKFISAPVGLICFPERDLQFYRDVMSYAEQAASTGFVPFAADLTSDGSDRMSSYLDLVAGRGLGYQTIWSSTNDSSNRMKGQYPENLRTAVCTAIAQGADYIEIYAVDVLNPDATIQDAIQSIHDPRHCPNVRRRTVRH